MSDFDKAMCLYEQNGNVFEIFYLFPQKLFLCAMLYMSLSKNSDISFQDIETEYKQKDKPVFPLAGKDLLKEGLQAGREIGDILKQTEDWWIEKQGLPDHDDCLNYAMSLIE